MWIMDDFDALACTFAHTEQKSLKHELGPEVAQTEALGNGMDLFRRKQVTLKDVETCCNLRMS